MKDFFNCQECVDLLMDYLEGNLEPETTEKLDEHMAACPPCMVFLKTYKKSTDITSRLKEQKVEIPTEVQTRLKTFLRAEVQALQNSRQR